MGIGTRLDRAETSLANAILWREVQNLACETGSDANLLFTEAKQISDRYAHLTRPAADGKVDLAPALQAIAAGEGLHYGELEAEVRRTLRLWRRRDARRTRRQP